MSSRYRKQELEAEAKAEAQWQWQDWQARKDHCYLVPERAKDAYLALEDKIGEDAARCVLDLVEALYGEWK